MLVIPLSPMPSQTMKVMLASQQCTVNVYQKPNGVFIDLYVNDAPIMTGVICRDRVKLVRQSYLGFVGDLVFVDTQGTDDPTYTGFGSRFLLLYLETSDLS
ncbi:phage baseplate plug family protein [Burkholderia multivorans]|uniref:phage baseplate plug family protein n=1 Tax=Burkholderia multivorans TaxID=87883 RepID=UPI0006686B65|nr:hypothetical protein [Burkholderia multivorans]